MARILVGFLILANAHLITAMAADKDQYFIAEAPKAARKLGKHDHGYNKITALSPSESLEENTERLREESVSGELRINHRHHWIDEPVAGGGVILGALVAAFMVTIFCYIRVTGRGNTEQPSSPTNLSTLIPNKERS